MYLNFKPAIGQKDCGRVGSIAICIASAFYTQQLELGHNELETKDNTYCVLGESLG